MGKPLQGAVTPEQLESLKADLGNLAKYLNTPIATYTYTANKEVVVSAVNVATDTFTSVGHGLVNGDKLYPIMNYDAGNIYPVDKYPNGISFRSNDGYYVINKTTDTFQLSLTSDGATIDLTTNANMDLTKWHFEMVTSGSLTIAGLPSLNACKIKIIGRNLLSGSPNYVVPTGINPGAGDWIALGTGAYAVPQVVGGGDISIDFDITLNYARYLTTKYNGIFIKSSSSTANISILTNAIFKSPKYVNGVFTSIDFKYWYFANGTTVEVYKV